MRTGVTSVLNCGYSTLSHKNVFFMRSTEMVNNRFRHNIIDGFDNENMKFFKIFCLLNIFKWIMCVPSQFVVHVMYANIAEACANNLESKEN